MDISIDDTEYAQAPSSPGLSSAPAHAPSAYAPTAAPASSRYYNVHAANGKFQKKRKGRKKKGSGQGGTSIEAVALHTEAAREQMLGSEMMTRSGLTPSVAKVAEVKQIREQLKAQNKEIAAIESVIVETEEHVVEQQKNIAAMERKQRHAKSRIDEKVDKLAEKKSER